MKDFPARGFTLVEVLIAVTVIAILTGLGLASYRRFDSTRKVEAAAVGFGTFLRTSQKKADAGELFGACDILKVYYVETNSPFPSTTAQEEVLCGSSSFGPSAIHRLVHGANFVDYLKVGFRTNSGGVEINNLGDEQTEISMSGTGRMYVVTVGEGGAITVERKPGT